MGDKSSGGINRAVDTLARVADHRITITAGWLSPPAIVLLAPKGTAEPLLLVLMGVVLVLQQAQISSDYWKPDYCKADAGAKQEGGDES